MYKNKNVVLLNSNKYKLFCHDNDEDDNVLCSN